MWYINLIRWLKMFIKVLGGITPVAQTVVVRELDFKKVHNYFQVPVRHIDFASMALEEATLMVSIAAMGGVAPIWVTCL